MKRIADRRAGRMINDYLFVKKLSMMNFAKKLEISPGYLYNICSGKFPLSLSVASKIESASDGYLKAKDLLFPLTEKI